MKKIYKLAILDTHFVQYRVPLYRKLSKSPKIDLTVYFCSDFGIKEYYDPGFDKKISWKDVCLTNGYKYKFLKNYSPKPSVHSFFGLINPRIIKELFKNKYDAIIVHGYFSFTNWLAFFGAWLTKTSILFRGEMPLNQEFLIPKWKQKIKKLILKLLFKMMSGFLAIGNENKKFYMYYGVPLRKIFFTPYCVENERFIKEYKKLKNRKTELKKELEIKGKVIILFVGKLIPKKRPLDVLLAYEKIRYENKALIFVGEGILREKLEKIVSKRKIKNVYFVGFKNQSELPKYYAIADIFVLPSGFGETWGLVVNEAMCFKLPVVVSNIVGCRFDLVKHKKNGYVFPAGDVRKLSKYLENLVKDSKKREQFGENSFEIIQKYNYDVCVKGILEALERGIEG